MTQDKKISIHAKVPVLPFIEAIREYLTSGDLDNDRITEMLAGYFTGDYVRHRSLLHITASIKNPSLSEFFANRKDEILASLSNERESRFICFALMCARYRFAYDIAVELAKLFRLQDLVSKEYLKKSIGKEYGYNESVRRSLDYFIIICEDANVVSRPIKYTFQQEPPLKPQFQSTIELWKLTYKINEPLADVEDNPDLPFEPFFRYLNLF